MPVRKLCKVLYLCRDCSSPSYDYPMERYAAFYTPAGLHLYILPFALRDQVQKLLLLQSPLGTVQPARDPSKTRLSNKYNIPSMRIFNIK